MILAVALAVPSAAVAQIIKTPIGTPTLSGTAGPAPTGLTATPTSTTSVAIGWNAMSGAKGYLVERRKTSDPSCCYNMSGSLALPGWTDNGLAVNTQYTYRVNVTYTDGSTGYAEVSATTPVMAPMPDTYGGVPIGNVVQISWSPVIGASGYSIFRNGVEFSGGGACSPTCVTGNTGDYGATYSYAIRTFFPTGSNVLPSTTPNFSVTIPHVIGVPAPGYYLIARDSRVDFQITNTANPDGTRGGIVSGSGNGVTINDPGLNKLAIITTRTTPLGIQKIALKAANTAPASVDVVVMRTPGKASLTFPGVTSGSPAGSTATLRVDQLGGPRWSATFNSLAPIEFERENNFGGATFCTNSDAVGVVLSSNGKKLGLSSPWGIVLQELNRSASPHVLDARRISSDGKTGLVPMIYLTPDCTIAVIVDISDNAATPYRIRTYDLLTRQMLGTDMFAANAISYDIASAALFPVDNTTMRLSVVYPNKNQLFSIPQTTF
ncbi:MAG TPA: hypothetical protein VKO87_13800 [Gemmatimonadaceae bacterium]|nr:hypothetical protein [Gemmatimonadaceae bacterium]